MRKHISVGVVICSCEGKHLLRPHGGSQCCQSYLMSGSAPCCSSSSKQRVFLSASLPTARCIAATPVLPSTSGRAPCESSSCTHLPSKKSRCKGAHPLIPVHMRAARPRLSGKTRPGRAGGGTSYLGAPSFTARQS